VIRRLPTPPSEPKVEAAAAPATGTEESKAATSTPAATVDPSIRVILPIDTPEYWSRLHKVLSILQGDATIEMQLHFLWSHNKSDLAILRKIKTLVEGRNSVTHHATVVTHGFMHAGTTVDTFLRENLTWLSKATNWAKFSSTASLGVVHKGHLKESKKLLQPYLPVEGGVTQSPYSEGGAVFALGLIHANKGASHNGEILSYLRRTLQNTRDEVVQHGACLGIALAGMATGDSEVYEQFKGILYQEQAVAGEAAGLGIGLLFLGRGSADTAGVAVQELLSYAHETKHEKIIRGVSLGVALIMYGQENEADTVIEQMVRDKDPIIRYGGMYTIALAYVGSGSNDAVRRLLHVAVSDVSNDVRRAAVMAIGFVLFRTPDQVPRLVKLLSESYNPHVRYGACLAVGIACAGTASAEGIRLVAPMMQDNTDFVRQGAMLAMAMMLMQETATKSEHVKELNEKLEKVLGDKNQSTMTKMGATLASGILNAGGRNVTITLQTREGIKKMGSIVGLALGLQYWYWYPLIHLFSLAFTPTVAVGLNVDLQMPKEFKFQCDAAPSLFAYPDPIVEKKEAKKERVTTAVLRYTE
jgi:26S proteasome regulatory subunit N2